MKIGRRARIVVLALAGTGFLAAFSPQAVARAEDLQAKHKFEIPAQALDTALLAFSDQAKVQVLMWAGSKTDAKSPGAIGEFRSLDALSAILANTGLGYKQIDKETVAIVKPDGMEKSAVVGPPLHLAQSDSPAPQDSGQSSSSASENTQNSQNQSTASLPSSEGKENGSKLEEIVVTGSHIRGGYTASPTVTIDAKQIQEEGFTDLGEVIRSLPQNFSGGQNPGVVNGTASSIANSNLTGGSSLNLRGLGPDATLTLLNGRRMSYGGSTQMVDISAIPVEAVDRIEIVADGASAIYGSDAVGGVGNVILKRDFDGVTVGARYGGATDGGLNTREYTVTAGTTWSTGGLIATWKKTSSDPVYADQRDYTQSMSDPATLYSGNDLRSGLLSVHQSLGDIAELRLDVLRTVRDMTYYYGYSGYYILGIPQTTTSLVSPSVEFSLPNDWTLNVGGTWGEDEADYYESVVLATGASLYGFRYGNKSRTYEVGAEGPLLALPGGDARLAVGAGYRYNDYLGRNLITGAINANGDDSSRFAYAELNLPFISPDLNITGIHRLEFSAALRGEDYNSFGSVTTPKFGLIYGPSADFTFKASWGKSFKAPTLLQRYQNQNAYLYPAMSLGGTGYASDATVLMPYGGNRGLEPERARTWSTSLAFHPEILPGLQAELTWFDIDYTGRVVQPITNSAAALNIPSYAPFIEYSPTATEQADILATFMLRNFAGAAYDPSKVVAVINNQYINASRQRINGLDLSGAYRFDIGPGRLTINGSASWLDSSQQTTAAQSPYDLSGTLFNPPKVAGRLGAVWNQHGFSAAAFANYKSGVTNTADDVKSASFTTFDVTLRYDTGERGDALSGLAFELSMQNLFDRAPPLYNTTSFDNAPYDSTNYSAIGRYLSLSVSKHF